MHKLKFMIAVILPFSPTLNLITADILVVLSNRVKRSMLFWYQQRLVHNSSSTYILPKLTHPAARVVCDS